MVKRGRGFFEQLLRDKQGNYNLRETVTMLFVIVTLISWVAQQFFQVEVPEFMFYSFVSLVGAGCFGYSIERGIYQKSSNSNNNKFISYDE